MPTNSMFFLPKTKSWQEFEIMVCDCAITKWQKSFSQYGRAGQNQKGIDIVSDDRTIAIQCKNYLNVDNVKQLEQKINEDYSKVSELPFQIQMFVVATAYDRDNRIQDYIYELSEGKTKIEVMFWDEISAIIASNPMLLNKYYPNYINRNRKQLFSLAFFGVQIAELIGLTLGDRNESSMYCRNLKSGAVWFEDMRVQYDFISYVNAIEAFALGDLSIEDVEKYNSTNAYQWGKNIEKIVISLLENLNEYDRICYLAGFYLGNFFRNGIDEKEISVNLIEDFKRVVEVLDIPKENKERVYALVTFLTDSSKVCNSAGQIFDQLRLVIV